MDEVKKEATETKLATGKKSGISVIWSHVRLRQKDRTIPKDKETPEQVKSFYKRVMEYLKKIQNKEISVEQIKKDLTKELQKAKLKGKILVKGTKEKGKDKQYPREKEQESHEYISLDGDGSDSLNETMEIKGYMSEKDKRMMRFTAAHMRQIDQELSKAEADGRTEDVIRLTDQWEAHRELMNVYVRSPKIRVNQAKKKNIVKNIESSEQKKKGIHRDKSRSRDRGRERERTYGEPTT